jgi:hypothetical protein
MPTKNHSLVRKWFSVSIVSRSLIAINRTQENSMKKQFGILCLVMVIGYLATASSVMASWSQRQKITSTPRGVGAQFGNAVAMSGNTMVVGARYDGTTASQAGAAFVYVLSGGTWTQQAVLLANDGAVADKFGYSVAISENTIVVGAFNDDSPLSNAGSAYVFVRSGTTWTFQQKLTAGDATADDQFGNSVAITGEVIAVGANHADLPSNSEAGAVYVYLRTGTVWAQTQRLSPSLDVLLGDHFGDSLAVSGNKLVIGASGDDTPFTAAGAVYVFVDAGTASYGLQQKLTISSGQNGDNFGFSVAIEGNTLIGGAIQWTPIVGQPAFGAAYVYEFNGSTWVSQGRLTASDGASVDRFGYSVAVSNNVVAVGAREDDTVVGGDAGSAYIFRRAGTIWTQRQKLTPSDPFNGDRFGVSVALSFGNLVVGAAEKALSAPNGQGAAYYYIEIPSCSSASFSPALNFGVGVFPVSVAVGDFNRDGKPDIATANGGSDSVSVLLGNGAGSFGAAVNFSVGTVPYSVAVGDFNLDGKPDLAAANRDSGNVSVLLGNGAGSFGAATNFNVGTSPRSIAVGDFNLDAKPDLVTANTSSDNFSVLLGNGAGNFAAAVNFSAGSGFPIGVALGDFNGDGKLDLASGNNTNTNASVLLGNGAGSFAAPTFFGDGFSAFGVTVGDFNLDARLDLVTSNAQPNNVSVLFGNGAGGLGVNTFFSAGNTPISLAVGDFNLDDQPDLVAANAFGTNISVLLGNGAGSFAAAANFDVDSNPNSVAMGDFNLDGKPDLVTSGSTVSVRLNTCGQSPRRTAFDFDGDGKSDISIFRPSNGQWWYQQSFDNAVRALTFGNSTDKPAPADYDGDGKTDIAIYRPSTGEWFVLRSSNLSFYSIPFGISTDKPAPADFDGDGFADIAVFRASEGTWYINKSSGGIQISQWGAAGDVPENADYDGDGKSDIAIFRPSAGTWWINRSTAGTFVTTFGVGTDKPVPADYTGDGKTDIAVWRPGSGAWYVLRSEDLSFFAVPFGSNGDVPTPADFDGDGKTDFAIFRPSGANWFIQRSTAGILIQQFGTSTDVPVASAFIP